MPDQPHLCDRCRRRPARHLGLCSRCWLQTPPPGAEQLSITTDGARTYLQYHRRGWPDWDKRRIRLAGDQGGAQLPMEP